MDQEKVKRTQERVSKVVYANNSLESNKAYEEWAIHYDDDMKVLNRGAPDEVALEVLKHVKNDKLTTVLDVGAGTGISAEALKRHGFIGIIDAVEYSASMLKVAQAKSLYRFHMCFGVTPDDSLPVEDNSYDCLISVGAFIPNHIAPTCLVVMLCALKSSGILVFNTRKNEANKEYLKALNTLLQDLKNKRVIDFTEREIVHHGRSEEMKGVMMGVLYVCKKII